MKINSIQAPVYFGYNKQINDKVNKKLEQAKGNKELAQDLLTLNKLCLTTEDKLRKAEKDKNHRLMDIYEAVFMTIKPLTTELLEERFPLLNYKKTELDTYKQELEKRKITDEFHWLPSTVENLMDDDEFEMKIIERFGDLDEENTEETPKAETPNKPDKPKSKNAKKET